MQPAVSDAKLSAKKTSVAPKSDRTIWNWGYNYDGQLGDGTTTNRSTPVQVSGLVGAATIARGYEFGLAAKTDGSAWGWGDDFSGEPGDGFSGLHLTPVSMTGISSASAVAGGDAHPLIVITAPVQVTTTYGYDGLYRLTNVVTSGVPITYRYDPVGNRSSLTKGGSTANYAYDRADRIQQAGTVTYTMNANGNLTSRGSDTFAYDQANRLRSANVGSVASTYAYNGDGNRANKTVAGIITSYVNDANGSLPVVLDDGTYKYIWGPGGLAYSVDITGNAQVYYSDGLGSIRAIADGSGNVIETYQTDGFGVPVSTQGSVSQPFQYAGEQQDAEDGFYYLRARMYDPSAGRFLNRDPFSGAVVATASLNRYVYAADRPTLYTDPSGKCVPPVTVVCVVGTGVVEGSGITLGGAAAAAGAGAAIGGAIAFKDQIGNWLGDAGLAIGIAIGQGVQLPVVVWPGGEETPLNPVSPREDPNIHASTGTPSNFPDPSWEPQPGGNWQQWLAYILWFIAHRVDVPLPPMQHPPGVGGNNWGAPATLPPPPGRK